MAEGKHQATAMKHKHAYNKLKRKLAKEGSMGGVTYSDNDDDDVDDNEEDKEDNNGNEAKDREEKGNVSEAVAGHEHRTQQKLKQQKRKDSVAGDVDGESATTGGDRAEGAAKSSEKFKLVLQSSEE
jgi:cobalamin biosynthesis protein CobT